VLLVALGGAIGTLLRYFTSGLAAKWFGIDFPYGTVIVNLVGSFLIGLIQEIATGTLLLPENARLFLTTGLMGGLTTYSAFSYETVRLAEAGAWPQAWINVVGTTAGCLLFCVAGIAVGRLLIGLRG
jgi:CrcB protein